MAKATLNPALIELHGKVGRWVYRNYFGKTVVSPLPETRRARSAKEQASIEAFTRAARRAKAAPAEMKARYRDRAAAEGKTPFSICQRDYRVPPTIDGVNLTGYNGLPGDPILVRAHDDFEVKSVHVAVRQAGGWELEAGEATRVDGEADLFCYVARCAAAAGTDVTVDVTAADWPGNTTTARVERRVPER